MNPTQPITTPAANTPSASTLDPVSVGQKIKAIYPAYAGLSDAQVGLKYITKYGANQQAMSAVGVDPTAPAQSALDKTNQEAKDSITQSAQSALQVINNKGKYTDPGKYKEDLENAISRYNSAQGFSVGGKTFSPTERDILGGLLVKIQPTGPGNPYQRFMGTPPVTSTAIAEPEDAVKTKLEDAIQFAKTGTVPPPSPTSPTAQGSSQQPYNLGGAALNDTKNIINSIAGIPAAKIAEFNTAAKQYETKKDPSALIKFLQGFNPTQMAGNAVQGYVGNLNQDIGQPLKGGDIVDRAVQNFAQRPVGTALDVLPFAGAAKGLISPEAVDTADAAKIAASGNGALDTSIAPKIAGDLGSAVSAKLNNLKNDIQGRAATAVVGPIKDKNLSVQQAENIYKSVVRATNSTTSRGMAKELDSVVLPETGNIIDANVAKIDKAIGPQPKDEIIEHVMGPLEKSSEGQANPELLGKIKTQLDRELQEVPLPGGAKNGELNGTTMAAINDVRKSFNADTKSWHNAGRPVGTPTNDFSSLKWQASNELKDIMKSADPTNLISNAIDLQHNALEARGTLSAKALDAKNNSGLWNRIFNLAGAIAEPAKIAGIRAIEGKGTPLEQMVQKGTLPKIYMKPQTPTTPATENPVVPQVPMKSSPLPTIPNAQVIKPQQILRDNRYKTGTFQGRRAK